MPELIERQVAIDNIYVLSESIICAVEEESPEIADKIVAVRDLILKKIKEQPTIEPEVRRENERRC